MISFFTFGAVCFFFGATLAGLWIISTVPRSDKEKLKLSQETIKDLRATLDDLEPQLRRELSSKYEREQRSFFARKFADRLKVLEVQYNKARIEDVGQVELQETIAQEAQWIAGEINHRFDKMSRVLIGDVNEIGEEFSASVRNSLIDNMWACFQQYKGSFDDLPIVLPYGTRIAYTKGHRTIFVIEQRPCVRSVSFTQRAVDGQSQSSPTKNGFTRYNLSFPYMYFFITYDGKKCVSFSIYLRNKTIRNKGDVLYPVPLPNIFQDRGPLHFPVCMGTGFWETMARLSMVDQANKLVAEFWQRTFNMHLGDGGYKNTDPRIESLASWEAETKKDPMFVLTIDWQNGKKLSDLLNTMLDWREKDHKMDGAEMALLQLLEQSADKANEMFSRRNSEIKEKLGKPQNSGLEKEVQQQLGAMLHQHTLRVFGNATTIPEDANIVECGSCNNKYVKKSK